MDWIAPATTASMLLLGSAIVLRSASGGQHNPHRVATGSGNTPRKRRAARPAEPTPMTGGAVGLLEQIPYLERVHGRRRMYGTAKLLIAITFISSAVAVALIAVGRAIGLWIESLERSL